MTNKLSDAEKEIITIIAKALPKMSEFEKGYFLGIAEGKMTSDNRNRNIKNSTL